MKETWRLSVIDYGNWEHILVLTLQYKLQEKGKNWKGPALRSPYKRGTVPYLNPLNKDLWNIAWAKKVTKCILKHQRSLEEAPSWCIVSARKLEYVD